ncbi:hypothetical protein LJB76_00695 [Clostridia bacterium OttesenSCG-928-O13]|nr:hypothetical protein [Clostridia bacterium OttesenSCG-928-O13]
MKKLLFSRTSECIQPLRALVEEQKHRTLVAWALEGALPVLALFEERVPGEKRPRLALETADAWARGDVKMPLAKKAIHAAHAAAALAENDPVAQAAARAAGHAAATVHVETHALGLVFYGLTAYAYAAPAKEREAVCAEKLEAFTARLLFWQENIDKDPRPWAPFLLREDAPNKEKLLRQKEETRKTP